MATAIDRAKAMIDAVMDGYQRAAGLTPHAIFAANVADGKVYEAWVLCELLERLEVDEGFSVALRGPSTVTLKSSPGPINRAYSYFELDDGRSVYEVWTDVEFLTLSFASRQPFAAAGGDFHELDIVVVGPQAMLRPEHDEIAIGVECKHRRFRKELLRAVLGVRRELSLLAPATATPFRAWPRADVPAHPPSCLLVYCSSPSVTTYAAPGVTFGIDFIHSPLP